MYGIENLQKLDDVLDELYKTSHPAPLLYGLLMHKPSKDHGADVLIGDFEYYDLKSGDRFHILAPGWDLKEASGSHIGEQGFHKDGFVEIELAIAARTECIWRGYNGGYQLILTSKNSLGTDWKRVACIDIESLVRNKIFDNLVEAFNEIINLANTHRHNTPYDFCKGILSYDRFKRAIQEGKEVAIEIIGTLGAKTLREFSGAP